MATTRTSKISRLDFQYYNPWHGPEWRYQLAEQLSAPGTRLRRDERTVLGEAVAYIRESKKATSDRKHAALQRRYPHLSAARQLYTQPGVLRDAVEARLLAGQSAPEIAAVTGLSAEVLSVYSNLFFDLPQGRGLDWIVSNVLRINDWAHRDPGEGDCWRYLGLAGGPQVVDLVIGDYLDRPCPNPGDRHVLAERGRLLVKNVASVRRSLIPNATWIQEQDRHFSHLFSRRPGNREEAVLREMMNFSRVLAGMPKLPEPTDTNDKQPAAPGSSLTATPTCTLEPTHV